MNRDPNEPMDPVLREFTRFVISKQGQQVIRNQGIYLPLRGFQADGSRAKLD